MKAENLLPFLSKTSRKPSLKKDGKSSNGGQDLQEKRRNRISFKNYLSEIEEDLLASDLEDNFDLDDDLTDDELEEENQS